MTVLAVLAVVAVPLVAATPLKLNPPFPSSWTLIFGQKQRKIRHEKTAQTQTFESRYFSSGVGVFHLAGYPGILPGYPGGAQKV